METYYRLIRSDGFYTDNMEFLYSLASATTAMIESFHYPSDSPAGLAATLIQHDAEENEFGEWRLSEKHARMSAVRCYNSFLSTGLYMDVDEFLKRID